MFVKVRLLQDGQQHHREWRQLQSRLSKQEKSAVNVGINWKENSNKEMFQIKLTNSKSYSRNRVRRIGHENLVRRNTDAKTLWEKMRANQQTADFPQSTSRTWYKILRIANSLILMQLKILYCNRMSLLFNL